MANTFKNYTGSAVGTSPSTVYTVPALTTSVTIGLNIANVSSGIITVDVQCAGT